ncbi:MAG TPA: hypothetical protein GX528_00465 [Firmicutes bacterium]|nr:hypothetical protein [Bacillota bacterium]
MIFRQQILAILVITFVLGTGLVQAFTPDRALENPLFLAEIGDKQLLFASCAWNARVCQVFYAEYDEFAKGYGAIALQTAGKDKPVSFSFIAVKEFDDISVAVGVHRVPGEVNLAAGLAYNYGKTSVRAAVHAIPVIPLIEKAADTVLSLGAATALTETVSVGVDFFPHEEWAFEIYSSFSPAPPLKTLISIGLKGTAWHDAGIKLWFDYKDWLIHVGYTIRNGPSNDLRCGIGFKF